MKKVFLFALFISCLAHADATRTVTADILKSSDGTQSYTIGYTVLNNLSGTNTGDVTIGTANGLSLAGQVLSLQAASSSLTGALTSTDWSTFNSKEPAIAAGTTAQYWRGDKTFQTLDTSVVPENTNLYYTNARGIGSVLTGYVSGAGTITATDTILEAIQKLNGNIVALPSGWLLSGNSGTTAGTDFIGTTDAQDVVFKRNSVTKFTVGNSINISSNVLQVPNGTVSLPGFRLTTDDDTGFYQTGDGNLSVAANGAQVASFDQGNFTATVKATTPLVVTPSIQAPAASKLTVATDAGTQITFLQGGGWESSETVVPADATGKNQYDIRTYASPSASTNGANNTNFYSQLVYDNPNAGFDNSNGSMIASNSNFTHNGSGTINYASTNSNSASFNNSGVTQQFKGVTSENSISSGATVSDYYGMVSGLNTTGGIVSGSQIMSVYANFNDATLGQVNGLNQTVTIDGTSTNSQGVNGLNTYLSLADTAAMTNGAYGVNAGIDLNDSSVSNGVVGYNFQANLRDASSPGPVNIFSGGINQEGSVVSGGTNAINLNMQYVDTADGSNVNGINVYAKTEDTAHLDSYNSFTTNPEFEGSSTVDNITMVNVSGQLRGSAVSQNVTGLSVNTQISGTAAATNFTGAQISPSIANTATVTNGMTALQVNPSSTPLLSQANGITISMDSVDLSPSALAGGAQKKALTISDGAFESNYEYTVPAAASFFQTNYLGGAAVVASGAPTSAFGFGNNLAHTVLLHDDWNLDASGLGFVDVGFVGALNFDSGTTMARWNGALGGAGNPGGAGTLTDAIMFRAAGILPQGGSLAVTNMYGFQVDENLFCLIGTNCWGIYENTAASENHLSKLAIGTSSKKVTNSSTALEIGNSKAFLNGRGSTATKNALTAVAGMQFYDTDLDELQYYDGATWVSTGGGGGSVTSVTASAPLASSGGATPNITISQATTSTNGYLSSTDWNTFNNKEPAITAGTTAQYWRGDKTFQTLDTLAVPENTNLYYTNARGIGSVLTGYVSGAGTVAATDTILQAIQKLNGNTAAVSGSAVTSLTGDVTASGPGAAAATLATVNASPGSYTNATITVNAKGLVTSASSGAALPTETQEVPSGTVDNSNVTFTLANSPTSSSRVKLYQDGLILIQGTDYTISGATITMTVAPNYGQSLYANYYY